MIDQLFFMIFIMSYEPYKKHGMASLIYTKRRI